MNLVDAGLGAGISDVLENAGRENDGFLRDQCDTATNRQRVGCGQRYAVQAKASRLRIVKAQEQLEDGRFAGARRADQGDALARRDGQVELTECGRIGARGVAKIDVLEIDFAARLFRERVGIGRRADVRLRRQQFEQALGSANGALQIAPGFGQRADRAGDQRRVEDEGGELAGGDASGQHVVPADPEDQRDRAEDEHHDRCDEDGAIADAFQSGAETAFDEGGEVAPIGILVAIGLDDADFVDGLVDAVAEVGDAILADPRQPPHAAPEQDDRRDDQRHAGEHQQGQLQAGGEQHGEATDQNQQVAQGDRKRRADGVFDQRRVGRQP